MGCLRNPAFVRLVTMVLLTVSDVDWALTLLFLTNLTSKFSEGIIYGTAFGLVVLGFLIYSGSILFLAPKQQFKVMSLVKDLMRRGGAEFVTHTYKKLPSGEYVHSSNSEKFDRSDAVTVVVCLSTPVEPGDRNRTFNDLVDGKEHQDAFRDGLIAWGVGPVWDAVEITNARNCLTREHGIPFYRTARFGFMAQHSPKDLCGIFNANALYSFAVGTFELIFGALMFVDGGLTTETVLPLGVSAVSFVLALANVIFDFSATLTEIEAEERMASNIKNRLNASEQAEKANLLSRKDRDTAEINKKYAEKRTPVGALFQKEEELDAVRQAYHQGLDSLNRQVMTEMHTELTQWKQKLQKERDLLRGKSANKDYAVMQTKIKQIEKDSHRQLNQLDVQDPEFEGRTKDIIAARQSKITALKESMTPLMVV